MKWHNRRYTNSMPLYLFCCALSGALWGGIAFVLMPHSFGPPLGPGVIASPFIGLLVGGLTVRLHRTSTFAKWFVALGCLYGAVAVFAVIVAIAASGLTVPEHLYESVVVFWVGLTVSGLVLLLWPLAFLNHQLLWRVLRKHSARRAH